MRTGTGTGMCVPPPDTLPGWSWSPAVPWGGPDAAARRADETQQQSPLQGDASQLPPPRAFFLPALQPRWAEPQLQSSEHTQAAPDCGQKHQQLLQKDTEPASAGIIGNLGALASIPCPSRHGLAAPGPIVGPRPPDISGSPSPLRVLHQQLLHRGGRDELLPAPGPAARRQRDQAQRGAPRRPTVPAACHHHRDLAWSSSPSPCSSGLRSPIPGGTLTPHFNAA